MLSCGDSSGLWVNVIEKTATRTSGTLSILQNFVKNNSEKVRLAVTT